jgi:hypothetical protein
MSRSANITKAALLMLAVVFFGQALVAQSGAQMNRRASHADHILAVLHGGFLAESAETLDLLTVPEQVYLMISRLEMEAYNGGLPQFFSNSSGAFVPHLAAAFKAIGAEHVWPIVEEAVTIVGPDVPWRDDVERWRAINNLNAQAKARIRALNDRFGKHLEELSILLLDYVLRNREPFRMPEEFWKEAIFHDPR